MKMILKHIANIQTGIYAQTISSGKVIYLQAKHFDESGHFYDIVLPDLPLDNQTERHLLNSGDIIFAAKGSKNFAAQFEGKNGQCVASSTFLVIRLNDEFRSKILSEYITWFINHPRTQDWLKSKARGSSIPSISKNDLQELEISIPSIKKQETIIKIDTLQKTEKSIVNQIQLLKEKYIQHRLISAIK